MDDASDVDKIQIASMESDETCELCGHPMVYKFGRYGKFLACSNFPECKNTKPITIGTGVACPKCGEGEIVERKSKRGRIFYGCNRYPQCDFTLWDKPTHEFCDTCGSIIVEKSYKMVRRRNSAPMKHVQLDHLRKRERKRLMIQ